MEMVEMGGKTEDTSQNKSWKQRNKMQVIIVLFLCNNSLFRAQLTIYATTFQIIAFTKNPAEHK